MLCYAGAGAQLSAADAPHGTARRKVVAPKHKLLCFSISAAHPKVVLASDLKSGLWIYRMLRSDNVSPLTQAVLERLHIDFHDKQV